MGRAYPVSVIEDLDEPDEPYAGEMDALAAMSPGDVGVYAIARAAGRPPGASCSPAEPSDAGRSG